MILEYPTIYQDSRGIEKSKFISDDESLKIELRGITFEGHFRELSPVDDTQNKAADLFDLTEFNYANGEKSYELNGNMIHESSLVFSVNVQIPIKIVTDENTEMDGLIDFGTNSYGKFDFIINGKRVEAEKPSFEFGLIPDKTKSLNIKYIKCCINCMFSEYSPFGNQDYGDLMCFKSCKEAWLEIGYTGLKITENWEKIKKFKTTQEAYFCEEFKLRE